MEALKKQMVKLGKSSKQGGLPYNDLIQKRFNKMYYLQNEKTSTEAQ